MKQVSVASLKSLLAHYKSAKQWQPSEADGDAVVKGVNGDYCKDCDDDDKNNSNLSPNKSNAIAAIATAYSSAARASPPTSLMSSQCATGTDGTMTSTTVAT
jgi:hypothetical protein